jgi:L-ascorbate metabolism protein UlaG (beta-lactamase superfamily)
MRRRTLLAGAGFAAGTGATNWACRQRSVTPPPHRPDVHTWTDRGLYAAWIGHSTVLLKIDGTIIVTDPVFSSRIGVNLAGLMTVGPKRLVAPALGVRDLPRLDGILLSHAHFDHFDLPSLRRLEHSRTQVVTAARTSDLLRVDRYQDVRELHWGEHGAIGPVKITAFRVKHWGARIGSDLYRGYNGYILESGRYRVLFAGDTAWTPAFRELKSAKPFDLAIMPVGAYNPWVQNHCTPEQAERMARDAGAERVLPVHHQTFPLSNEPYLEPIERLHSAAGSESARIVVEKIGQEFAC